MEIDKSEVGPSRVLGLEKSLIKKLIAEFIGTAFLVFSISSVNSGPGYGPGWVQIALASGFPVTVVIAVSFKYLIKTYDLTSTLFQILC